MAVAQNPAKLHKITYILVWVQAVLGGVLLANCLSPIAHTIFLSLTAIGLLCVHIGKTRATRVITRAVASIFWVFVGILAVTLAEGIVYGLPQVYGDSLVYSITLVVAPYLCYLAPVTTAAMLFHGEHTAAYDRLMGFIVLPAQIGAAYMALFTAAEIPRMVGEGFLPYLWLVLIIAATIAVWMSVRAHTPAQQTAIDRRRQKRLDAHEARIEKRKNGAR